MNRYSYCFNVLMVLVDLNGACPSLSDIGRGIEGIAGQVVECVKAVPWKRVAILAGSAAAVLAVTIATGGIETLGAALAVGATTGAAAGVSIRATTDIISGKNSSWQDYVGDGVGGAVTGIVSVLAPGAGLSVATTGMIAGGTASMTSSILKGKSLRETGVNTIVGGLGSLILGKIGGAIGTRLKGTALAQLLRDLNKSGFDNLGKLGARGEQALRRILLSYIAYKTPVAAYSMLTQELGDMINDHVDQCIEGD